MRTRALRASIATVAVVLVLATSFVIAGGSRPARATTTNGTSLARLAGIATGGGILWEDDQSLSRDLDAIANLGVRWIRFDIDWNSIQYAEPSTYFWNSATDRIVTGARARGLSIIGTLIGAPRWAVGPSCPAGTKWCLPRDPGTFATFAAAAVQRYGAAGSLPQLRGSIEVWEVWNEPNHSPFAQPRPDPSAYASLLRATYPVIKGVDPFATVVTGGTSPAPDAPDGTDYSPNTWLGLLYANGARGSFDAVGHHPYAYPFNPLGTESWNAVWQTGLLHQTMVANGEGYKKIWGTESGAPTAGGDWAISEAQQAQWVRDYFAVWTGAFGSFTGPLMWFQHRDQGTNPADYEDNFGLLHADWSPKPAYAAYRDLLQAGTDGRGSSLPGSGFDPIGNFEGAGAAPSGARLTGWALDPDTADSIRVDVWVDGSFGASTTASLDRPDVAAVHPGYGAAHGFDVTLPVSGTHTVCAFGINVGWGTNSLLGCRVVSVPSNPFGSLDGVVWSPNGVQLSGWAIDPNTVDPITVHVWIDGATAVPLTAQVDRPDVGSVYPGYGSRHGFLQWIGLPGGWHTLCAFGINVGPGDTNSLLGCTRGFIPSNPLGSLDGAQRVAGGIRVSGWAIDPNTATPIAVHVYVSGVGATPTTANVLRPDVAAVYPGYGAQHGFDVTVPGGPGPRGVCAYAINVGPGDTNPLLGCTIV